MNILKVKQKGLKISIIAVISLLIGVSAAYALNNNTANSLPGVKATGKENPPTQANLPSKDVLKKISAENPVNYDDWESVMEESSKKLPHAEEIALYNQGYDFSDITVAEGLAALCDKTPQELLQMKGKASYVTVNGSLKDNSKSWSDIISQQQIKLVTPEEALGFTDGQLQDMQTQGLSDVEIDEVAILSYNYKKDYKDILNEIKQGKKVDDLKKEYWQQKQDNDKQLSTEQAKANTEKILKKQYNITDEDMEKCAQNGLTNIAAIAIAKDIANKNNITLDQVLRLQKDKSNWQAVRASAGGK